MCLIVAAHFFPTFAKVSDLRDQNRREEPSLVGLTTIRTTFDSPHWFSRFYIFRRVWKKLDVYELCISCVLVVYLCVLAVY
jgi:hypothetical protein